MNEDIARGVIRRLTLKHREIKITGVQVNGEDCVITFEFIDTNLVNVANWIARAGGVPQRQGIEGTGDNMVCYAVFK